MSQEGMATPGEQVVLSGLARRLVEENFISQQDAFHAQRESSVNKIPLLGFLVHEDLVGSKELANVASKEFGLPLIDIESVEIDEVPKDLVGEKLIQKHQILPLFRRGPRLFIAVSDPTNLTALEEVKFHTGLSAEAIIADQNKLHDCIERVLSDFENESFIDINDADLDNLELDTDVDENLDEIGVDVDDAPIVRFVNKMLVDAVNIGASDIHFEVYEKDFRIRYRLDGILREISSPPVALASRIAARIKIMSRLDISERRVPQDGRIKMRLSRNHAIDFRVNTCPTLFGEKVVLRILDPSSAKVGVEALGFEDDQKALYLDAIHRPQGMVLVTGPTGSGKTVSLYTALNILNTDEKNISTAEDPVEINLTGINQVNVNPKIGLSFSSALRAFLRQDPDIVMVGEIRDLETAEIAIKAAQTGHMVLSTLHTNSAPETLTRLVNMGVEPFNIATSVNLIIAQRLARRLCESCKASETLPREACVEQGFKEQEVDELIVFRPVGCDKCHNGYKGRVGVYEVLPISEEMGRLIMNKGNAIEIADLAKQEGFVDLREAGLNKVRLGITSLEEINRITTD